MVNDDEPAEMWPLLCLTGEKGGLRSSSSCPRGCSSSFSFALLVICRRCCRCCSCSCSYSCSSNLLHLIWCSTKGIGLAFLSSQGDLTRYDQFLPPSGFFCKKTCGSNSSCNNGINSSSSDDIGGGRSERVRSRKGVSSCNLKHSYFFDGIPAFENRHSYCSITALLQALVLSSTDRACYEAQTNPFTHTSILTIIQKLLQYAPCKHSRTTGWAVK